MLSFIAVGAGGFVGACLRYAISKELSLAFPFFPFGTLVSNITAGLLIGAIAGYERQAPFLAEPGKAFAVTGVLGGLSTFSAFSLETATMLDRGAWGQALLNASLNMGMSLMCVGAGMWFAKLLGSRMS
ncbi:MAG: CrcB family protein [Acidaminococcales bacterium]|jgi:CrcB protein|nr:CrcB family protein [Acidaminococcales bacterium]